MPEKKRIKYRGKSCRNRKPRSDTEILKKCLWGIHRNWRNWRPSGVCKAKKPFCVTGCPVEIDIPEFIKLIAVGDYASAIRELWRRNSS